MNTFLETVTDDLIARYGLNGLGQLTLVFPMQRASLFVRRYLSDRVRAAGDGTPVLLPHFTTINALADSLCELGSEDEMVSVCRLYSAYCKHAEDHLPIDIFYGWGSQLLTDFSNSDMALLDVEKLMACSADAAELDELVIDDEVRARLMHLLGSEGDEHSVRRYFTSLWRSLPDICRTFRASQSADGVGTRGARSRWVVEHFGDEYVRRRIEGRVFVFVGFNYLLEAERKLMLLLKEHATTRFYWDANPDFKLDESIYKFLRDDIDRFGNDLPAPPAGTEQPRITAIACQSSASQASYVHDWLLAHHHEGDRTAVVLADESLLQPVIYALPRRSEGEQFARVNVTKGYPLRNTRIYAETVRIMEKTDCATASPDEQIVRLGDRIEHYYRSCTRRTEDDWQQVLSDEAYYQTQLVLREMRMLLRDHAELAALLTQKEDRKERSLLFPLIRRRLESVSIPFHGEPVTDIQIIGVLETRLLDFDNVLILNVEEGVVPNTSVDRSFIPYDLRKAHGMQTRDEEAKIYGYNFFRLLRRARDVTMAFSEASTDIGQKTMSRFLMQMLASPDYTVERGRLEESSDTPAFPTLDGQEADLGSVETIDHLSPSSICDWVECHRKFYLAHVRGIHEPEDDTVMFASSTFGTLVHGTLEQYYRAAGGASPLTLSESLDKAYEELNGVFNRHHPQSEPSPYRREEHESENHVILHMAQEVLQADKRDNPVLIALEHPFTFPIRLESGRSMPITGKVDRIDTLTEEGRKVLRVADYKTGAFRPEKVCFPEQMTDLFADPKSRYALQTLIYCAAIRHDQDLPALLAAGGQNEPNLPIVPELLFPRNLSADHHLQKVHVEDTVDSKGKPKQVRTDFPLTDYTALAEAFEEELRVRVNEIMSATDYPPTDADTCAKLHCPFHLLCGREKKDFGG